MKDNEIKFIRKTLAKNLLRLRKFKGVSQQQLINQIGEEKISLRTYKDYETGNSNKLPQLDKIIDFLDILNALLIFFCIINKLLWIMMYRYMIILKDLID